MDGKGIVLKVGEETIIQIKICEDLRKHQIPFYHFVNEGKRTPQNASLLKKMGMTAGISDLFMPRGNQTFKGLWLEIKTDKGRPSPAQLKFQAQMICEGYAANISYGYDESLYIIKNFYKL
jgi:hypothetical protein